MSTHMLIAAAYVDLHRDKPLDPSVKLVLMAYADSSDEHSQESAPGLAKLRAWGGRGKSRTLAIVAELVDAGYLVKVGDARLGRRAVYVVFPSGVPPIPHPTEVAERFPTRPSPGVDNPLSGGSSPQDPRVQDSASRVQPTGPLQSFPSGIPTRPAPKHTARRVDKSTGGRFPGQRARPRPAVAAARCPRHPDQPVECRTCNLEGTTPDEVRRAAASSAAQIRLMMQRNADTHPDQETTP
jgi:hypothetical protein